MFNFSIVLFQYRYTGICMIKEDDHQTCSPEDMAADRLPYCLLVLEKMDAIL
jgi:hypothetical protein